MFREIEYLYKRESGFNKIVRKVFAIYVLMFNIAWGFCLFKISWVSIFVSIVLFLTMIYITLKEMGVAMTFDLKKLYYNISVVRYDLSVQEVKMIKNLIIKNKLYKKEIIEQIIEHYRMQIVFSKKTSNFWTVLSVIISLVIPFITKNNFSYLFSIIIIYLMMYFTFNQFLEIKKVIRGEDEMYKRLEEIFLELYSELINKSKRKNISK